MAPAVPRLSVIVPCFEAQVYLGQCLNSVLAVRGNALEVVAIDDASTDGTGTILGSYARRDPRLRVVQLPANVGPGPARNIGLDHAHGEYVWFVDADDWLPPSAPQAVLDRLLLHEPDVLLVDHAEVFGDTQLRRRTVSVLGVDAPSSTTRLSEHPALLQLAQSACTKIIRRSLLSDEGLRFPPGRYEDALFSPLVLMAAESIDLLDQVCYCYRQMTTNFTATPTATHFDVFDQYDRLFIHVDEAAGALDGFRSQLFRIMIDHYLVILGHRYRVPKALRRHFFDRVVADYVRWRPAEGYPTPGGIAGVKHALVRTHAYPPYSALRWAYRLAPRRSPIRRGR